MLNQMTAIGNLGRDPELRYTPAGMAVCNFSIAVNEKRKDKAGEYQDVTLWFRITCWDKMAENVQKYVAKGDQIFVQGRLSVDEWTDRDGNNRYTLEITANQVTFLNNNREGREQPQQQQQPPQQQQQAAAAPAQASAPAPAAADDDDTPDWAK